MTLPESTIEVREVRLMFVVEQQGQHAAQAVENSIKRRAVQAKSKCVSGKLVPQADRQQHSNDDRPLKK